MSTMDATNNISDLVAQAGKWGHKAIAITDHGGAQAFPDAHHAGEKAGVKILYGVEANIVDDGVAVAYNPKPVPLTDTEHSSLSAAQSCARMDIPPWRRPDNATAAPVFPAILTPR